jgi:hypothetical protein
MIMKACARVLALVLSAAALTEPLSTGGAVDPEPELTSGGGGGGPLLPCGTTDASSLPELQSAFAFAHGVCCTQLGETCGPSAIGLPTTCASATCARAVVLVNASCAALLVSPTFPVGIGFQPLLDAANDACAHAAAAEPVREQPHVASRAAGR